jgi:dihydrofolate reductase
MSISLIVAMDKNQVIGKEDRLPWYLPEDLKYFKKTTTGHPVIMGRKTFESIGRPLPNRSNIVLSRNAAFAHNVRGKKMLEMDIDYYSTTVVPSLEEFFQLAKLAPEQEFFVIGGKEIYQQFYSHADRLYVTHIDHEFDGDTQWSEFSWDDWELNSSQKGIQNEKNPYSYYFTIYERKEDY